MHLSRTPRFAQWVLASALIVASACSDSGTGAVTDVGRPTFAAVVAPNLIANPALEASATGRVPTNWSSSYWGSTPVFSYPVTGRTGRGATVTQLRTSTGDARWQHAAVTVVPGGRYTFSIWYRSTTSTSVIAEYSTAAGARSYAQLAAVASSGSRWVQYTTVVTVPTGVTRLSIYQAITRAGSLTIDDVSLTALDVPATPPTISLTASANSITVGQSSTLSWSSTNATACSASGAWTGAKSLAGTQVVSPTASSTYTLTCTGAGGTATQSVVVGVGTTPPAGQFAQGMVSLTFDDAWESQYVNALPILQSAGLKGTFYLTTIPVEQSWSLFMTPAAVLDIAAKGHEIAGHTLLHPDLLAISIDSVRTELAASKAYLESLTGRAVTSFAYPFGNNNAAIQSVAASVGYTSARTVAYAAQNIPTTNKYALNSMCIEPTNTVPVIKAQIDAAMANKQWFILCFHDVKVGGDNISITPADFQQIIDYLKLRGTRVVTVAEGRALMAP